MHFSRKQIRESNTLKMVKQAEKATLEKQLNESKTIIPEIGAMTESSLARSKRSLNIRMAAKAMIKEHFLTEAIKYIYNECMIPDLQKESTNIIRDTVICGFIKENGVENIIRTFNTKSLFLADIAKTIKEATEKETTSEMVAEVFHDFELLINDLSKLMESSEAEGDEGTSDFALGVKKQLEKNVWMLKAYLA